MKHFSRLGTLTMIAGGALLVPLAGAAGPGSHLASNATYLMLSNSSQGYLGVGIHDVDNDRASVLKLKDPHGAEITSIDKDAPAFKSGLRIHDVVVQMNGQRVEGIEQFRRMLHETPPGRTITLVAIHDGQPQSFSVQLADRTQLATQIIVDLETDPPPAVSSDGPPPTIALPSGSHSSGFFGSLTHNRYYVGVDIQPLPTGLADYFGVRNGVLVGNVFSNSPASAAGLKPADVIQKVNGQPIVTLSDWEKAIHANRGKRVQVTIIRDRKEQTLSMIAGATKGTGELGSPGKKQPDTQTVAELSGSFDAAGLANQLRQSRKGPSAEALLDQAGKSPATIVDANQIDNEMIQSRQLLRENSQQLEQQMQSLRDSLNSMQLQQMD